MQTKTIAIDTAKLSQTLSFVSRPLHCRVSEHPPNVVVPNKQLTEFKDFGWLLILHPLLGTWFMWIKHVTNSHCDRKYSLMNTQWVSHWTVNNSMTSYNYSEMMYNLQNLFHSSCNSHTMHVDKIEQNTSYCSHI